MTINMNTTATRPLGNSGNPSPTQTMTAPVVPDNAQALPTLKITRKKGLPSGVASNVKQLVLLLCDISTSMIGPKLDELNLARQALGLILADPVNKDGFLLTLIDFNHSAQVICSAQPATTLTMPDSVGNGGTNFDAPINAAIAEIEAFNARPNPDGWHYLRSQVLFLSDGQAGVADSNIQKIQEIADVTTIAYGSDADQSKLARIASDGEVHVVGTDGGALRDFLAEVGKTMTSSMAQAI